MVVEWVIITGVISAMAWYSIHRRTARQRSEHTRASSGLAPVPRGATARRSRSRTQRVQPHAGDSSAIATQRPITDDNLSDRPSRHSPASTPEINVTIHRIGDQQLIEFYEEGNPNASVIVERDDHGSVIDLADYR